MTTNQLLQKLLLLLYPTATFPKKTQGKWFKTSLIIIKYHCYNCGNPTQSLKVYYLCKSNFNNTNKHNIMCYHV